MKTEITYQTETIAAFNKLTPNTVAYHEHLTGLRAGEPIIVMIDGLIRYAKAHKAVYGSPLASDYVLGENWLETLKAARSLCDGVGAVAMERNAAPAVKRLTDSKCNGSIEQMFESALTIAGFDRNELGI